jgi:hypothetical protein
LPQPLTILSKPFLPPWATWIHAQKDSHILGHVPFPAGLHVSDYQIETERMLAQIIHRKPIVNGYSGFFPRGYDQFQLDMAKNFPSPFLICFLETQLNVDSLIIDFPWYKDHQEQMTQFKDLSRITYSDKDVVIIKIPETGGDCHQEENRADRL